MDDGRHRLYRARDGMILGVCRGIARYRDLPVAAVRIAMILLTVFTGFWPGAALYFLAGFLMDLEPALPPELNEEQQEWLRKYEILNYCGLLDLFDEARPMFCMENGESSGNGA